MSNVHDLASLMNGWLVGERIKAMLRSPGKEPVVYPEGCLTFASAAPFTIGVYNAKKNWDGTLYYSTDAATWNEWDGTTAIPSAKHGGEQKIYMRGSGNTVITGYTSSTPLMNEFRWKLTGTGIRCVGNIENLLDYETVTKGEHPVMASSCYRAMFALCSNLVTAPELPAKTMTGSCYAAMFYNCNGLTIAPRLPATILALSCYEEMFHYCTFLTTASALPATTLAERCYYRMFSGCSSLASVPSLPATTLPKECYARMFYDCTGLKISATQSDEYPNEYRIPVSGTVTEEDEGLLALAQMFYGTSGTAYHTPSVNKTYYTANEVIPYE